MHLTQTEMAERLGVSRAKYKNWEYGTEPPFRIIETAELLSLAEGNTVGGVKSIRKLPMAKVPIVGSVSAGAGTDDNFEDMIYVPAHMVNEPSNAWVAEGDSMMPWIQPGDIIIAKDHRVQRINTPFLVRREDGTISVKVLKFRDGSWILHSLNPAYNDEPAEVELIVYVTGIYRVQGSLETMICNNNGLVPTDFF